MNTDGIQHTTRMYGGLLRSLVYLFDERDGERQYKRGVQLLDSMIRVDGMDLDKKWYDIQELYLDSEIDCSELGGQRFISNPIVLVAMYSWLVAPDGELPPFLQGYHEIAERLRDYAYEMYLETKSKFEVLAETIPESRDLLPDGWHVLLHPYSAWHIEHAVRKEKVKRGEKARLLDPAVILFEEYKNRRHLFADLATASALKHHGLIRNARTLTPDGARNFGVPKVGGLFEGKLWWDAILAQVNDRKEQKGSS